MMQALELGEKLRLRFATQPEFMSARRLSRARNTRSRS